jgi:hypothetical protein
MLSVPNISPARRLVALKSIARGLGHFHRRAPILSLRDPQAFVGLGPEWPG